MFPPEMNQRFPSLNPKVTQNDGIEGTKDTLRVVIQT
jgi:hypothetical protein